MKDVTFSTLDASIRVGGEIRDYRNGLTNIQAGISGTTGLKSLEWLRLRTGLADAFQMRNPLQISRIDVNWHRDRELMVRGKLQVSEGPAIGFATRVLPDHVEVEHVSLRDDLSDVNVGVKVEDTNFDFRFKGKLVQRSIARVFRQQHFQFGELSGEIRTTGNWRQSDRTVANGSLQGAMITIPAPILVAVPVPVTLEKFFLEGRDQTLQIKSATVAVGDSKLDLSGSFGVSGDQ